MRRTSPSPTQTSPNQNNWGIIYSPNLGGNNRWKKILNYLYEKGVAFDFVQSENHASVQRLASMMTKQGYRTIIIVGGDAALNYALNGIMNTESPNKEKPELGIIPNGFGNNFAKYWNIEAENYKQNIDNLLARRIRRIDVGRLTFTPTTVENESSVASPNTEESQPHPSFSSSREGVIYFINSVNIGVVASIVNTMNHIRHIRGVHFMAYFITTFALIFRRHNFKYDFSLPGESICKKGMTLCVGSAHGYGQTPSAVPYNGMLDISLTFKPQFTKIFHGLWLLYTERFLSHKGISIWRTKHVNFHSIDNAPMSLDGRAIAAPKGEFHIDILHEKLDFLY